MSLCQNSSANTALKGPVHAKSIQTIACQAPLSMGFSRQEYWSGLPWPPPGGIPNPGIKPTSLKTHALSSRLFITGAIVGIIYVSIMYISFVSH